MNALIPSVNLNHLIHVRSTIKHDFGFSDSLVPNKRGYKISNLNINSLLKGIDEL